MNNQYKACHLKRLFAAAAVAGLFSISINVFAQEAMHDHGEQKSGQSGMMMNGSMNHMKQDMGSMKMSGDTDYDFATMMRMHHQQGVNRAEVEIAHGKDEKMKAMARKMVASQKKEIAEFDQWLSEHKQGEDHHESQPK